MGREVEFGRHLTEEQRYAVARTLKAAASKPLTKNYLREHAVGEPMIRRIAQTLACLSLLLARQWRLCSPRDAAQSAGPEDRDRARDLTTAQRDSRHMLIIFIVVFGAMLVAIVKHTQVGACHPRRAVP
jgi:hypothetical protein